MATYVENTTDISGSNAPLQLDGTTSLTIEVNDIDGFNDAFLLKQGAIGRVNQMKVFQPTYYVQATFDINGKINRLPGENDNLGLSDGNDDAWSMAAITVAKSEASGEVLKLPTGEALDFLAAQAHAFNDSTSGQHYRTFDLKMDIYVDDQGDIVCNDPAFTGGAVSIALDEDTALAQAVGWQDPTGEFDINHLTNHATNDPTSVAQNDVDTLVATLSNADVTTHHADDIATAVAQFNGKNALADWTISFDAVTADTESNLSAWARASDSNDPFGTGDKIVTTGSAPYEIKINDHNGNEVEVVASGDVYGVLKQA